MAENNIIRPLFKRDLSEKQKEQMLKLPIQDLLIDEEYRLLCPICEFEYNHMYDAYIISGNDNYGAGWKGRGDLMVLPIKGECGSSWELCVGFHKGNLIIFTRLIYNCVDHPKGGELDMSPPDRHT